MGLQPYKCFNFSVWDVFLGPTLEADVYRRQILKNKEGPHDERVNFYTKMSDKKSLEE